MDNLYFKGPIDYKYCYDCKYYRGGTVCDILMRIDKAKPICIYYEKIKGGNV